MRRYVPFQKTSQKGVGLTTQINHFESLSNGFLLAICSTAIIHQGDGIPRVAVAGTVCDQGGQKHCEFGSAMGYKFQPTSSDLEQDSTFVLSVNSQRIRIGFAGKSYSRKSGWLPKYLVISIEPLKSRN